jgi:hypothetical protein
MRWHSNLVAGFVARPDDGARRRGQGIDLRRAYTLAFVRKLGVEISSTPDALSGPSQDA